MDIIKGLIQLESSNLHILESDEQIINHFIEKLKKQLPTSTFLAIIEGNKISNLNELFEAFISAFEFPDYFGNNWAAFDECINDLDWLDASSYVLVIKGIDILNDEQNFKTLIRILCKTANEWTKGRNYDGFPTPPIPFHIIFAVSLNKGNKIERRIKDEGFLNVERLRL